MIDPFAADKIKTIINKEIANIKDHICYGIDSVENWCMLGADSVH